MLTLKAGFCQSVIWYSTLTFSFLKGFFPAKLAVIDVQKSHLEIWFPFGWVHVKNSVINCESATSSAKVKVSDNSRTQWPNIGPGKCFQSFIHSRKLSIFCWIIDRRLESQFSMEKYRYSVRSMSGPSHYIRM